MTIYSRGLLIGRFQPFHKGHLYLFHYVKSRVKKLVIGVGSANVFDEDNTFTFEERKKMIERVIIEEKLQDSIAKIVSLNDYYDDERWFRNTLHKSGPIDVIIGNNEWPNRIFETRGYKIWRVGFFKKYLYEGEKIRNLIKQKKQWNDRVPNYLIAPIERILNDRKKIPYRFHRIGIGGTFDHFHEGHKKLIDTALQYGHFVSIGVTTKPLHTKKNFSEAIENYKERKKSVVDYLKKKKDPKGPLGATKRAVFFPLSDIYGTTKTDGTIEAIVVSKETYHNAIKINKLRDKKSLPELKIIKIDDVRADDGELLSSEKIRRGEVDRNGKSMLYSVFSIQEKKLILPEELREELRKPLGKVIKGGEDELEETVHKVIKFIKLIKPRMIIAVGDIIADSLEKSGFIPDVKIIDYRSRRKPITAISSLDTVFLDRLTLKGPRRLSRKRYLRFLQNQRKQKVSKNFTSASLSQLIINRPGTISKAAFEAIKKAINSRLNHPTGVQPRKIIINGEEDLLALPAILFAPLNSVILYGQMDLGVVMVEVTEEKKKEIKKIVEKFNINELMKNPE